MGRSGLRQAAADERRPLRCPNPTGWAGPGAAVAWFLRLLDTYAPGRPRLGRGRPNRALDRASRKAGRPWAPRPTAAMATCLQFVIAWATPPPSPCGRPRVRPDPTLPAEGRSSSPGEVWRRRAGSPQGGIATTPCRRRAQPGPSTHPTGTGKPSGAPAPRASAEPCPGTTRRDRPVGSPAAKGGCLVPCPVSVPRSSASSPRASC
jgi:hypothetical protein